MIPKRLQGELDGLADFLTRQSAWIYFVLFLFLSYLLMLTVTKDNWAGYFVNFGLLCGLYAPVLVFTTFRSFIRQSKWPLVINLLWGYCFIGHSFVLYYCRASLMNWGGFLNGIKIADGGWDNFIIIIGGVILLVELAILLSDNLQRGLLPVKWLESLGLEKVILLILALLTAIGASFSAFDYVFNASHTGLNAVLVGMGIFLLDSIQLFLIYLVYYFFYYINHYFLIPKIFKEKGVIYYGFSVAGLILLSYPIFVSAVSALPLVQRMQYDRYTATASIFATDGGGLPFVIMVLSVPVIIAYEWFRQDRELAVLEKEKTATELSLLKQQINPHFFFNTLNNLYALSITKDEQTPEVVLQLSELMRYVIYLGKEEQVSLEEEIKYIEDYVQLQQIRLHKKLDFQFEKNLAGPIPDVAPLLFIVLVENAFKHGIEPAEKPCYLHLNLKTEAGKTEFICENSLEQTSSSEGGIGLENLRRRLALLYPDRHQLQIEAGVDHYKVTLSLDTTALQLMTQPKENS
ncbi:MAG: sensor histidine kinase [Saprospiraceae bacterium]|nr:sensor histidine kinase [Saprospiraceae bacterium]